MTAVRAPLSMPVTIIEPQLQQLQAGVLGCLIRPDGGVLARARPGDRLWVREPFHLHHKWNGLSPTAAAKFGARPSFVADGASEQDWDLGPRRYARNLLRQWHCQHLVVTRIERNPVQAIPIDLIEQQGFRTRPSFAAAWDSNLSLNQGGIAGWARYHNNPQALEIHFDRIMTPLPVHPKEEINT